MHKISVSMFHIFPPSDFIQAFYNWAIAISDRAKMRGRTKEAEELWKQVRKNKCCILLVKNKLIWFSEAPALISINPWMDIR